MVTWKVRHRQQLRLAAFEPLLGLRGVALRATAITAGVVGEHLGVARLAVPDLAAERRGAAVENVLDGALVRRQHRRAMSREVVCREAAEHLGDLDHDRASEAGHQPIEQTVQRRPGGRGQVSIDGSRRDAGVTEQDLHDAGVDAVLDQSRGIAVAKAVWGHSALDARGTDSGGESARQHTVIERRITGVVGEQPAAVVVGQPQAAQFIENRLWQRHQPLLVALADNAQHLVGPVDGTDFQCGGLADAQTARIHDGEAGLVDRVTDAVEKVPDLIVR